MQAQKAIATLKAIGRKNKKRKKALIKCNVINFKMGFLRFYRFPLCTYVHMYVCMCINTFIFRNFLHFQFIYINTHNIQRYHGRCVATECIEKCLIPKKRKIFFAVVKHHFVRKFKCKWSSLMLECIISCLKTEAEKNCLQCKGFVIGAKTKPAGCSAVWALAQEHIAFVSLQAIKFNKS